MNEDVTVNESRLGEVVSTGSAIKLIVRGKWSKSHESLCREFNVDTLLMSDGYGWKGNDVAFIARQQNIKSITIGACRPIDCTSLGTCDHLVELRLLPHISDSWGTIAFERMSSLRVVVLEWRKEWSNILRTRNLNSLEIRSIRKVRVLDLSQIVWLESLSILSSRGLQELETGPEQRLKEMRISLCQNLAIDLDANAFKSLRILWVEGKCRWWMDAVLKWTWLQTLRLTFSSVPKTVPGAVKRALDRIDLKWIPG